MPSFSALTRHMQSAATHVPGATGGQVKLGNHVNMQQVVTGGLVVSDVAKACVLSLWRISLPHPFIPVHLACPTLESHLCTCFKPWDGRAS